ncbi:MAG: DHH family phosphoesterase [Eubacteriales bacterium]|nr:DHH family phosphoesterase [Eubacteriales bacterium]
MKHEKKFSRRISISLWLPILMVVFVLIVGVCMMESQPILAYILIGVAVIYLTASIIFYEYFERMISNELVDAGFHQSQLYKSMMVDLPIPYVLTTVEGTIVWHNDLFEKMVGRKVNKRNLSQIFAVLHKKNFPQIGSNKVFSLTYEDKNYEVDCRCISVISQEENVAEENLEEVKTQDEYLQAFYFFDVTQLEEYKDISEKKRLVAGLIYIDNYEEVLENMEEVRQSLLLGLVERKIVKYLQSMDAIVKRFERDKFIFVFQQKNLEQMLSDKFVLLDEVRAISAGNELSMTLSIGVGLNGTTYQQNFESARTAMGMALGRGGDQAVVKDGDSISYYGGKTQKVEKTTRVKARVKAHALREMMISHDTVYIMGHKNPDADCFGAALGIYRLAKTFDKKVFLVMDKDSAAIQPIVSNLEKGGIEDVAGMFLTNEEALFRKDPHCMLVVVDVNIPSMTECPGLLKNIKNIVVLDHHRQAAETIKNAVLSYVEPYASSSCEMVAEVLQYISDKPKLKPIEADALYSGILVDTDNFVVKAGVRTFEAAAYLRRAGADVTRVRKMFREDQLHHKVRAEIIQSADIFMDEFAIAEFYPGNLSGATVVGAKAANELLNIQGIRGSFVVTQLPDYIYISARAIDDLNVQVIMEKMGGGGHLTVAATQIREKTMDEVVETLKGILLSMKEEGEI